MIDIETLLIIKPFLLSSVRVRASKGSDTYKYERSYNATIV